MISIITPVLNGEKFLRDNIESIRNLKIPYEHIIVDGGSTDNTMKILSEYPEVIILSQKGRNGMYEAIDQGIKNAKGEYLSWINCDDRIISSGYTDLYSFAIHNKLDLACSDGIFYYIYEDRKKIVRGTSLAKYLLRRGLFPFSQPSVIFSKSIYSKSGGFNYKRFKICGDGDLFQRIARINESRFGYLKATTSIFIKHGNSLGDKNEDLSLQESRQLEHTGPILFDRILMKTLKILKI